MTVLIIGELLGSLGVGQQIAAVVIGAIVLLRLRRYRAVGAAAVGAVSSAATVVGGVIGFAVLTVAAGWWDPPVAQMVGDVLAAVRTAWEWGLDMVFEKLVESIREVADGG